MDEKEKVVFRSRRLVGFQPDAAESSQIPLEILYLQEEKREIFYDSTSKWRRALFGHIRLGYSGERYGGKIPHLGGDYQSN